MEGTEFEQKEKEKVEFRYYEMPPGIPLLALLGEKWIHSFNGQKRGDCLHFHNYMEIGYCYSGRGEILLENTEHSTRFEGDMLSIIPRSYPMPRSMNLVRKAAGNICLSIPIIFCGNSIRIIRERRRN